MDADYSSGTDVTEEDDEGDEGEDDAGEPDEGDKVEVDDEYSGDEDEDLTRT